MPSPFPGMDPYLENPGLWPDVHLELISGVRAYLGRQLRPRYNVRVEERVYLTAEADAPRPRIVPDVRVSRRPGGENGVIEPATRVEEAEAGPIVVKTLLDDEVREPYLEILDVENGRVVTVIEILSPSNKLSGSAGHASFVKKRREVMTSTSHWVEIDLLRGGVGVATEDLLPKGEYLVHVSRVEDRPNGLVWPVRLSQRLPTIPIPLQSGEPDGRLELQLVLDSAYDRANYDMTVRYDRDPAPPLPPEWAAWADRLLKEKGLRPSGTAQ